MVLSVEGLSLALSGRPILRSVSLDLAAGRILGLTGKSGTGKSQLLRTILGLQGSSAVVAGTIRMEGVTLLTLDSAALTRLRGARIGMIFQDPLAALDPLMPVGRQIAETVRLHRRVSRRGAWEEALRVLARVGLPPDRVSPNRYPHQLSGGQRQRVAIALAIVLKPALLLADEPTAALDATSRQAILTLLRRLTAEDGMALLMVSHDLPALASVADEIAVLHDGVIVERGPATDLLSRPGHPVSVALVAEARPVRLHRRPLIATGGQPILEACGLHSTYAHRHPGRPTLEGVDLRLMPGEILGVVGESGAGKSTLALTLLGLLPRQRGEIRVAGSPFPARSTRENRRLRRHVQAVFQDPYDSFDPHWRVGDIVAEPLSLLETAVSLDRRRALVTAALQAVGLDASAAALSPHRFSGGQRQRIAIARALIVEPDAIVMDEATSALDQSTKLQILHVLAELADARGLAVLFVSHDLDAVRTIADRVIVMREGRVVETATNERIFAAPGEVYTADLIATAAPLATVLQRRIADGRDEKR